MMTARQPPFRVRHSGRLAPGCEGANNATIEEYVSMNARRFDALTRAVSLHANRTSRRGLLRGLATLAAVGITPGAARAFDGGVTPVQPAVGSVACTSGADCAAGEICLNGGCAPRDSAATIPSVSPRGRKRQGKSAAKR